MATAAGHFNCNLKLGNRVIFESQQGLQCGSVRWIGTLPGEENPQLYVGVELDNPFGSGTGIYKGNRLFYTRENHASLIPIETLELEDRFILAGGNGVMATAAGHLNCNLQLGNKVIFESQQGLQCGSVRWIGTLPGEGNPQLYVGLELDHPVGSGIGIYKEHHLFYARENHASLVPIHTLKLEDRLILVFEQSEDTSGKQYLCEQYVWKTCTDPACPYIHGNRKLPYQWQIDLHEKWLNFSNEANLHVEKCFCQLDGMVAGLHANGDLKVDVNLDEMTADLYRDSPAVNVVSSGKTVRRLSTRSYVQGEGDLSKLTPWCWYWQEGDGHNKWSLYEPPKMQYSLEEKFLFGQPDYYFPNGDFQYKIAFNLAGMSQENLMSKTRRRVCRRPILVSERDVSNKTLMHPSCLVQQSLPKIANVPKDWTPVDHVQSFEMVSVAPDSDSYSDIKAKFFAQREGLEEELFSIIGIFQIQNTSLWIRHSSFKQTMEHDAQREGQTSKVDERFLFHGTDSLKGVHGICQNGIDPRMHGKHGVCYGKGAYFATSSKYSNKYTGHGSKKYMFYARVLVGQFTLGEVDMTRPPERKDNILYDSCVDNVKNPSMFVIFDTHQSYPDVLIEYR